MTEVNRRRSILSIRQETILRREWIIGTVLQEIKRLLNEDRADGEMFIGNDAITRHRRRLGLPDRHVPVYLQDRDADLGMNASPLGPLPDEQLVAAAFAGQRFEDDPRAARPVRRIRMPAVPVPAAFGLSSMARCELEA